MKTRSHPFPHLIVDGLFPPGDLQAAADSWPSPGWEGWHHYGESQGGKRASGLRQPLPPGCAWLLYRMSRLPVGAWLSLGDLVPDLGLWGAGLHELPPGPGLPAHLDADHHPRLGLCRAATVTLYLPPWEPGWAGQLDLGPGAKFVGPLPGRLVAFANTENAWHRVLPVTGPHPRRSLALFFYGPPGAGTPRRPRAEWSP